MVHRRGAEARRARASDSDSVHRMFYRWLDHEQRYVQRCDIFSADQNGCAGRMPANNSFQNCSIVDSNSWRVSAPWEAKTLLG